MTDSGNVRTLDFSQKSPAQVMPEDIFEGDGGLDESLGEPVPQFTEGTVVTGDFTPPVEAEPLTAATLHESQPFIYIEIPELGIQAPLDIPTALNLFDTLGAAINAL